MVYSKKFVAVVDAAIDKANLKVKAPVVKAIFEALSERDETADVCKDKDGKPEVDAELRDAENIPLSDNIEDLVQESFVCLREVAHSYRVGADGWSFYSKVLRYVILKQQTRNSQVGSTRLPIVFTDLEQQITVSDLAAGEASDPGEDLDHEYLSIELDSAIKELPLAMQEAIKLCIEEELFSADAADQAGCTAPAMRKRLSRTLVILRDHLRKFRSL